MKAITAVFLLVLAIGHASEERTWTRNDGNTMVATIVSADAENVTVEKAGRRFVVPLATLSNLDKTYVEAWRDKQARGADPAPGAPAAGGAAPPPGGLTFDGKPLLTGGKTNTYEYPYDPERLELVKKKLKGEDTGYKITLAVPADFDPAKPQKVFIACTGVNNPQQGRAGNAGMMSFFAKQCVQNGWVCLAYDSNIGRSNHDADLYAACEKLNSVWPQFRTWTFAVGGFSGGAKACFWPCAYLLKEEYKVAGVYMAGCNEDRSQEGREAKKTPKSAYKNLRVFLSTRNMDKPEAVSEGNRVADSLKRNGMPNVRHELHPNAQSLNYDHFIAALKWFAEP